jgi:hypothetical protein
VKFVAKKEKDPGGQTELPDENPKKKSYFLEFFIDFTTFGVFFTGVGDQE